MEKRSSNVSIGHASWGDALRPIKINTDDITLTQWLNMWGRLCRGAAGISGFPFWVQLLGLVFFDTIDQDEDGILGFEEVKKYYLEVAGVRKENLDKVAAEGYRVLTAVSNTFNDIDRKKKY